MKIDYHMHFEYGSYDLEWVQGFFESAKKMVLVKSAFLNTAMVLLSLKTYIMKN